MIGPHMHVRIPEARIKQFYYGPWVLQVDKNGKHLMNSHTMRTVKSKPLTGREWRKNGK